MQPQLNTNPTYPSPLDISVQRLVQGYYQLHDQQQAQFQEALLNGRLAHVDPSPSDQPWSWKDLSELLGPIDWAWYGWLAKGFLTIIAGESGTGKSALALRVAACFLSSQNWPDGTLFDEETGCVLWCETEAAQALNLERAKRWGLPIERIFTPLVNPLDDVNLDLAAHKEAIRNIATRPEIKLIVVDSLRGAHRGDEDSSNIIEIVIWLAELARDTGKHVLLLHHLRKRSFIDGGDVTLDRLRGSTAIVQPARVVWALDLPDPHAKDVKRLSVIKSNLGPYPEPLGLRIDGMGVHFGKAPEPPKTETQLDKAKDLILSLIEDQPIPAEDVEDAAKANGISNRTLQDAKKALGVVSMKQQSVKNGPWMWSLPVKDANL